MKVNAFKKADRRFLYKKMKCRLGLHFIGFRTSPGLKFNCLFKYFSKRLSSSKAVITIKKIQKQMKFLIYHSL